MKRRVSQSQQKNVPDVESKAYEGEGEGEHIQHPTNTLRILHVLVTKNASCKPPTHPPTPTQPRLSCETNARGFEAATTLG